MNSLSFLLKLSVLALFVSVSSVSFAQNYNWKLAKEDKTLGIQVFTSEVEGSNLDAFKGEMLVKDKLWRLLALLNDTQKAPLWIENCKSMKLIEQKSEKESIYYTVNRVPWPLQNRDLVSLVKTSIDQSTRIVTLTINNVDGVVAKKEKLVRIPMLKGFWRFIPKKSGRIKVVYQMHAEPGGDIPSWLANAVAVDSPFNTLKNMLKMLKSNNFKQTPPTGFSMDELKQVN